MRNAGQKLLIGIEGTSLDADSREVLKAVKPSGVIFFKRNYESAGNIAVLSHQIYSACSVIPFIAVDHEGGRVQRFDEPVTQLPPMERLGRLDNPEKACQLGKLKGKELEALGINVNFSPVLDINLSPETSGIGDRSIGNDKEIVAKIGIEYIKGYRETSVIPVGKHFPGHGDANADSHINLPIIEHPLERIEEIEIYPFKKAVDSGLDAVMIGHLLVKCIDSKYPATLSKKIATGYLKGKLGFKGLIFSDDMEMKGLSGNYSLEEIVIASTLAGIDVMLFCKEYNLQLEAYKILEKEMKKSPAFFRIAEEQIEKISRFKKERLKHPEKGFEKLAEKKFPFYEHVKIVEGIG